MKILRTYFPLVLVVSIIIGLDQWTKWLVRENIPYATQWMPQGWEWMMPYARFIHWQNSGSAFGLFQNFSWVFMFLAPIVALVIFLYYPQVPEQDWWMRLALGMQMAGALGNFIDRLIADGKVTDFISVGTFPVFNVADSSISVGTVILLIGVWIMERREAQAAKDAADASAEVGDVTGE